MSADYTGRRKAFMIAFTWIGAVACGSLFFFNGHNIEFGILAFTIGTIGYGGSIVFYNSFLPVIADPVDQDKISARGYSMGYFGSVLLLIFNLTMILKPGFFGIPEGSSLPARISLLTVFLWWTGFSRITFSRLPKYTFNKTDAQGAAILKQWISVNSGWFSSRCRKSFRLRNFLIGFFFVMMVSSLAGDALWRAILWKGKNLDVK